MTEMYSDSNRAAGEGIDLMQVATALGQEKFLICTVMFTCTAVALAVSLLLPPIYTARTTILPPQQAQSGPSLMGGLGALAASVGVTSVLKSPEELYVGLLKTDVIANEVIDLFQLKDRYGESTLVETRRELREKARFAADRRSTLISIDVDDKDPAFAASMANAYAQQLQKLTAKLAVTDAQQRRLYFERQMGKAKDEFIKAEIDVKQSQDRSGLASVDAQTQSLIGAAAQIRGQIVAREVQLQAIRAYAGPENSDLRRLTVELASLRAQLSRLEGGSAAGMGSSGSADALNNVRRYRDLKYQEAVYTVMLQQYQAAMADEARDGPLIQQVDVAVAPDRRSKPARVVIVLGATLAGFVLGLIVAFVRRKARQAHADAAVAQSWRALADAWALRRTRSQIGQEPL